VLSVSTNPFTWCSLVFWAASAVTVTSGIFCNIKHIYTDFIRLRKFFTKNTENGLIGLHSCNSCVIRTESSTHHCFYLKNVVQHFVRAERSRGFQTTSHSQWYMVWRYQHLIWKYVKLWNDEKLNLAEITHTQQIKNRLTYLTDLWAFLL